MTPENTITLTSDTATLCNIAPEKWPPRYRTYIGSLDIATPGPDELFALTRVTARRGVIDLGDKRTMEYTISAREIADDIAREINGDSGEGSFHGVFVCAAESPSVEEITDARARLEDFYRRLVLAADLEWERSHSHLFITDLDRRAARVLKLDKPWLYDPKPAAECPACGEKIKHGVAVCRACHAILDAEKAAQWGLGPAPTSATRTNKVKAIANPR